MPQIRKPVTGGKPWSERYTYVPALRVGNMVWLAGTTGTVCGVSDRTLIVANMSGLRRPSVFCTRQRTRTVREAGSTVGLIEAIRAGSMRWG